VSSDRLLPALIITFDLPSQVEFPGNAMLLADFSASSIVFFC